MQPARTPAFLILAAAAVLAGACESRVRDRDTDSAATSSTSSGGSTAVEGPLCESDEFALFDHCTGAPDAAGVCRCEGDCSDEVRTLATSELGGNCDYRLAEVVCSSPDQNGQCCFTVRVDVSC